MPSGSLLQQSIIVFGGAFMLFLAILWLDPFPGLQDVQFGEKEEERLGELTLKAYTQQWDTIPLEEYASMLDPVMARFETMHPEIHHSFKLHIMDDQMVNAFATLGGHILIFRGLLDAAKSREEVAAVLAHEIAHVELKHVRNQLLQNIGIGVIASAMGGDRNAIPNLTADLTSSAFSRKHEREADAYAFNLLVRAGIRPSRLAEFFDHLENAEIPQFLSTHPSDASRMKEAYDYPLPEDFIERPL